MLVSTLLGMLTNKYIYLSFFQPMKNASWKHHEMFYEYTKQMFSKKMPQKTYC